MFRYVRAIAALAALCLLLTGCTDGMPRSSGSTHAGMQTPAEDFSASAGNSMSGQMDNSIRGGYEADTPPAESRPALAQQAPADGAQTTVLTAAQTAAPENAEQPQASADAEEFLRLVNDSSRLPEGYVPPLADVPGSEKQLHPAAAEALTRMMAAAAADGCPLHLVSGYRSVSYQQGLFSRKVQKYLDQGLSSAEAEAEAARWVARPGASEHALGLAADIVSGDWYTAHSDLTADFEDTAAFAWLRQNAAAYGFILRYPAEKEAVTGVHYEPWHWRYVGDAAGEIAAGGLCLEEWLAQKTQ